MAGGGGAVRRGYRCRGIHGLPKSFGKTESGVQESAGYRFGFGNGIEEVEGDSQSLRGCRCKIYIL